ncbi:MAG: hypothetical protein KJ574_00320 [Nanoarchaeota archaeon]|nr:hypothetical protein [Nanoarchaeota archaeon]
MSIPYWIYLIVGGIVILVSYLIDLQAKDNKLIFFIVLGIVFLLVGLGKLLYVKMVAKPAKKKAASSHPAHHPAAHHAHRPSYQTVQPSQQEGVSQVRTHMQHAPSHERHLPEIRCHKCHAKLHPRFRYCPGCGAKVK